MAREFGDNQRDSVAGLGRDSLEGLQHDDPMPISVADALQRNADENDPSTWTIAGTEPRQRLSIDTAGVETVTIAMETVAGTTSFTVSGAATAAQIVSSAAAAGVTVAASGGPLVP